MKILIVDDCRTTTMHLSGLLAAAGYSDGIVATGFDEAMGIFSGSTLTQTPVGLVLMDVGMPGTDGIAATLTIKAHNEFEDIPIIVVTMTPRRSWTGPLPPVPRITWSSPWARWSFGRESARHCSCATRCSSA